MKKQKLFENYLKKNKHTYNKISDKLYEVTLNLEEPMSNKPPKWFTEYMSKFESNIIKRFDILEEEIKRFHPEAFENKK